MDNILKEPETEPNESSNLSRATIIYVINN